MVQNVNLVTLSPLLFMGHIAAPRLVLTAACSRARTNFSHGDAFRGAIRLYSLIAPLLYVYPAICGLLISCSALAFSDLS